MTLAEFTAVVDKRMAGRVLLKATLGAIGGCLTIFTVAIGPVLWVYSNVDENRRNNARLEETVKGLTDTVGRLQIIVATVGTEVKANRSDSADIKADIKLLLQQRSAALPARSAAAPPRRATQ